MGIFKKPDWYYKNMPDEDVLNVNKFTILLDEAKSLDEENKIIKNEYNEQLKIAKNTIKSIFGESSKEYKYISKLHIPYETSLVQVLSDKKRYADERLQKELKKKEDIEREAQRLLYQQEAVSYLLSNGKVLGKDFSIENSIYKANDFKFQELVSTHKEFLITNPTYIDFDGNYYCENCKGWDGLDNRCDCGNRRVCWTYSGDFKEMHIYPEAY